MKEVALRRLKELRAEAERLQYSSVASGEFQRWQLDVEAALKNLFGESSTYANALKNLRFMPVATYPSTQEQEWDEAFLDDLTQAKSILDSAIDAAGTYAVGAANEEIALVSGRAEPDVDLSSVTIGALLKLLTPAQAWGLAASAILLVVGCFTLGLKLSEYKLERAQARIQDLEEQAKTLRPAQTADNSGSPVSISSSKPSPSPLVQLPPLDLHTTPGVTEKRLESIIGKVRTELGVRALAPLEDGNAVATAAQGTFGFIYAGFLAIRGDRNGRLDRAPLRRNAHRASNFELAKIGNGEMILVVFVSPTDGVRLARLDGQTVHKVTLSPAPWSEASTLVLLPVHRLVLANDREIDTESEGRFTVLDTSIR